MNIEKAKGRPLLNWVGKRPIDVVQNFPAQLVEVLGNSKPPKSSAFDVIDSDWSNLLFHGDNKEVLSTLLTNGYRGQVDLIYIDPPFDSGANYVRKVELRGIKQKIVGEEHTAIEQIQYEDIWANDNYLQFMYERLILLRELLSDKGSIFLHCDWHKSHHLRMLLDEVFGPDNFQNEIIWHYYSGGAGDKSYARKHDTIFFYSKTKDIHFKSQKEKKYVEGKKKGIEELKHASREWHEDAGGVYTYVQKRDTWYIPIINPLASERVDYPTQKPEQLIEQILKASTVESSIVLDCFVGSGTTVAVAQKLGLRWIGADINKGAIQTTMKRLNKQDSATKVLHYRVNNYDFQEVSLLKDIIVEKYGVEIVKTDNYFDGVLGNKLVKITELNRPVSALDVQNVQDELKNRPNEARDVIIIGSGTELELPKCVQEYNQLKPVNKLEVKDVQTDGLTTYDSAEADVVINKSNGRANIRIQNYLSPTILRRLDIDRSVFDERISDFRAQIDVVLIDTNYDGQTFNITLADVPETKRDFILGQYEFDDVPERNTVAVKIIDMLGEETIITV